MSAIERVRPSEPRVPVAPQLALRVALLGGLAMILFGVVFFRLWYLQVLTGERYVQQADANRVRELPIAAPRGKILDREGRTIVASRTTNAVQVVPSALPPKGPSRTALYHRLGRLLGLSPPRIEALVLKGSTAVRYAPVTIKTDAGAGVLTVLAERANEYPGVLQQPVSIRSYQFGEMAAQILGHVDQVTKAELALKGFRAVRQGTVVGQEGLEYYYDRYLRGRSGVQSVEVNAGGYPVPSKIPPKPPLAGHSVKLTLDLGLQRESEKALREGIERAHANGKPAEAGAFTAIDPRNGQVLAIGSYPSFDPNRFAKPLTEREYKSLIGGSSGGNLTDRAVNGTYPTGSTFKPIVAMGALEGGVITPSEGLGAGQCVMVSVQSFCNAGHAEFGAVGLVQALKVSSDTYFFEVGERANSRGRVIQAEAEKLGIGRQTGIDLPSEFQGVVPDARWRQKRNELELSCERRTHKATCGIVAEPEKPWTVGDNMHLAVGQGDLLSDPLQMSVAYSTLANAYMNGGEGTVVTPHLGLEVDEANGGLVQSLSSPRGRRVHLNYEDLSLVMEGIHQAASQPGGTSADVWSGWDQAQHPVYGKTGTAQHFGKEDQSWYICYVADAKRPIVIAVTVEQGGFGAVTAAPIARLIASKWFAKPLKFVAGASHTL